MSKLVTITDAAKALAVSPDTVRRLIRTTRLKAVRVARRVLVPEDEVERICREGCGSTRRATV